MRGFGIPILGRTAVTPTVQMKTLRFKAIKNDLFFGKSVAFTAQRPLLLPSNLGLFIF